MAYQTPAQLKARFEGGDVPTEQDFGNLIDSTHPQVKQVISPSGSDDAVSIQTAFDASVSGDVFIFTPGTFLMATEVDLPATHAIKIIGAGIDATIFKATATMVNMFHKPTGIAEAYQFKDFTLNCDRLSDRGIFFERGKEARFQDIKIYRHLTRGIELGDGGSGARAFGCWFNNVWIDGDGNITVNRAEYGLYFGIGATDNKILGMEISYCDTAGVYVDGGHNFLSHVHVFGGPTTGIRAGASTTISDCFLDTMDDVGVDVAGEQCILMGNQFFSNSVSPWFNAAAVGIRLTDFSSTIAIGNRFEVLAKEIDLSGGTQFDAPGVFFGNSSANITTPQVLNFTTDTFEIEKSSEAEDAYFTMKTQAGQNGYMRLQTTSSRRWTFGKNNGTESGSDVGSNFQVNRYSDANGFLGTPILIDRSTGKMDIAEGLEVTGNLGFYGTTPIAKPAVTGATAGNVALQNLLTELANLGLITDSTT